MVSDDPRLLRECIIIICRYSINRQAVWSRALHGHATAGWLQTKQRVRNSTLSEMTQLAHGTVRARRSAAQRAYCSIRYLL